MEYCIGYIKSKSDDQNFEVAKNILSALSEARGCRIKLKEIAFSMSALALAAECKKTSAAIFADFAAVSREYLRPLFVDCAKELGLSTSMRVSDGGQAVVCDAFGGLLGGSQGYFSDGKFGRGAYCEEKYCELEIERTAHKAYEWAERGGSTLALIDMASRLETSRLWRKIVSDINEDYPSVRLRFEDIRDAIKTVSTDRTTSAFLASSLFAEIIAACRGDALFESLSGDGAFALLLPLNEGSIPNMLIYALKECLDLYEEAEILANATKRAGGRPDLLPSLIKELEAHK